MSEVAATPSSSDIQINVKGPSELKLQITISTDKTVLELKEAIAAQSDVSADRQRLIYSGRVLKDEDALSVYKIQSTHTIHMVKGVSRSGSSQQSSTPQPLPNMQTGQNPHDPLTQLNSHLGYGAMAGFNPFQDMGLNPNDPNMLQTMLNSPQFLQQMSTLMSNPAIIDQIVASNPDLAAMGPRVREVLQSDAFRELITNPERLQGVLQMASLMREMGGGPPGPFGSPAGSFPAPGMPSTAAGATSNAATATAATGTPVAQPSAGVAPVNPWASMFPPAGGAGANATPPLMNPFTMDPALLQSMLDTGGGGFGAAAPAPADTRPPEERFQVQLQQLQDMGFMNASQNVRALLATGGNVHSAIEYILSGGGL